MTTLSFHQYDDSWMNTDSSTTTDVDYFSSNRSYSSSPSSLNDISYSYSSPPTTVSSLTSAFPQGTLLKRRTDARPIIEFPSDGIVQRIRPTTMKNSDNGDFIICRTSHGAYVAQRTPIVPEWVKRLVEMIESIQR